MITKKVPCTQRVKDIESAASGIKEVDVGDGWVETNDANKNENADDVFDMDAEEKLQVVPDIEEEEEEVFDMDDL